MPQASSSRHVFGPAISAREARSIGLSVPSHFSNDQKVWVAWHTSCLDDVNALGHAQMADETVLVRRRRLVSQLCTSVRLATALLLSTSRGFR